MSGRYSAHSNRAAASSLPRKGLPRSRWLGAASLVALAAGFAGAAQAQGAAADAAGDVEAVVITGSRISTPGFTAPTPVTAISQSQLELRGTYTIAKIEQDIPALIPNQATQMVSSPPGSSTLNLRGLGSSRTLLLIDGRRVAPTSPEGGVDVNIMPVSLIQRLEIVTGGASAAYGSDAVAGVINLFVDDRFEGFKGYAQYGSSQRADYRERVGSVSWGGRFAGGKGHVVLAGDIYKNSGVSNQDSRDWGDDRWAQIANPLYVAGSNNGQPRLLIVPQVNFSQMTDGGLITNTGLRGTEFLAGGVPRQFTYGTSVGGMFMVGGGPTATSFSDTGNLAPILDRMTGFGRVTYDLSDNLTVWAEALISKSQQETDVTPNYDSASLPIRNDNPYIPAATRAEMARLGITTMTMGRTNRELGFNIAKSEYNTGRYAGGLKGNFNLLGSEWNWEGFFQYSRNTYFYEILNNRKTANWLAAIDPVVNPANGQIVCRSTLTNPTNGCVPINLFGENAISAAGVGYVLGTSWLDQTQSQKDLAFNVSGSPFSIWAGPVSVAFGAEYRVDKISGSSDPLSQTNGWRVLNAKGLRGTQKVKEGYFEALIPLLKDRPLAKNMDLNGAFRITDYSNSGSVNTWKVGLNWLVTDEIRLRGTRSRDIRAPNVNDLFAAQGANPNPVIDPLNNQNTAVIVGTGGNPNLVPEIGDTFTVGGVYSPKWFEGFQASVDYYDITVEGAISTLGQQAVVDGCYLRGQTNLCAGVTRDPTTNRITHVSATKFNADVLSTEGIDIEASYRTPLDRFFKGASGDVQFRLLANYVKSLATFSNGNATERAGAGPPHWRANFNAYYNNGPWRANMSVRWVQSYVLNNENIEGIDINDNDVPGAVYVNIGAEYQVHEKFRIYGKIDNLFDRDPPVTTNGVAAPQTATSPYFDTIGRFFAVGIRFNF